MLVLLADGTLGKVPNFTSLSLPKNENNISSLTGREILLTLLLCCLHLYEGLPPIYCLVNWANETGSERQRVDFD